MKYWKDETGVLQKYVNYWLKHAPRAFAPLSAFKVKFLLVWRADHETDNATGRAIAGKASLLSNKTRDIYGYDFMITIARDLWKELSKKQRSRLMWHELFHCRVEFDDSGEAVLDNEGRLKLWLYYHDLIIPSFEDEIKRFGFAADDLTTAERVSQLYAASKKR